jgi:hypothetical protein
MSVLTPNFPSSLDTAATLGEVSNRAKTTLSVTLTASGATSVILSDGSKFPNSGAITIDNEIIYYNGKPDANTLTIENRARQGTVAAVHLTGASVFLRLTKAHWEVLRDTIINIETKIGTTVSPINGAAVFTNGSGNFVSDSARILFNPSLGGLKLLDTAYTPLAGVFTVDTVFTVGSNDNVQNNAGVVTTSTHFFASCSDVKITASGASKWYRAQYSNIRVGGNYTGSGYIHGHYVGVNNRMSTGGATPYIYGVEASINIEGDFTEAVGMVATAYRGSTVTGSKIVGIRATAANSYSNAAEITAGEFIARTINPAFGPTTSVMRSVWAKGQIISPHIVTDLRLIALDTTTNTGTVTNSYGIYADTSIDVGSTTKYFIYSLSTSPSLITGNLGIGNIPVYPLDVTGFSRFSDGIGGSGTTPVSTSSFKAIKDVTVGAHDIIFATINQNAPSGSANAIAVRASAVHNVASNNGQAMISGQFTTSNVTGATTGTMNGIYASVTNTAGATSTTAFQGARITADNSGTATNPQGMNLGFRNLGVSSVATNGAGLVYTLLNQGTISNHKAIAFQSWTHTGTTTDNYLIYADTTTNIGTNKWGLYFLPDMPSYHVGKFGIGTGVTAPAARLQVRDTAEQVRVEYDANYYLKLTVGAAAVATFDLAATVGTPYFVFAKHVCVPDEAYGISWLNSSQVPNKKALYDKLEVDAIADGKGLTLLGGMPKLNNLGQRIVVQGALATGNNDVYTVPAGYQFITRTFMEFGNMAGYTIYSGVKTGGNYYRLGLVSVIGANASRTDTYAFVYESGETVFINSTGAGRYCVEGFLIPNTSVLNVKRPMVTTQTASTNTLLYTVPTGKRAFLLNAVSGISYGNNIGWAMGTNDSGTNGTMQYYYVPSGQTVGSGFLVQQSVAFNTANIAQMSQLPPYLSDGDSIYYQTSIANAGQVFYATVLEFDV